MMAKKYELQSMMLSELLHKIVDVSALKSCAVSGLALDSRDIKPGYVFIALQGASGHGIAFAQTAIDNGAVVILKQSSVDTGVIPLGAKRSSIPVVNVPDLSRQLSLLATRFYGDTAKKLNVVGITGTNGKTTCSQYIAQALHHFQATAVMGTLGNGFINELQDTRHTTPDNITVHRLMNEFYNDGAMNVVMEVSSHGIDQGRVDNVPFHVAMFTNLTQDHLDYHGNMEQYGAAKRKLFDDYRPSIAVINIDDVFGAELISSLPECTRRVSYSASDKASAHEFVRAEHIVQRKQGMLISIDSSWGKAEIKTPLLGRFNASNLLGALAVLLSLDVSLSHAVKQLASFVAIPGRMETIEVEDQPLVVIDYAHTPDALMNVLLAVHEHSVDDAGSHANIWCVFGCGGDRDKSKRAQMGCIAQQNADHIVLTDDNPRTEPAGDIIADIGAGINQSTQYSVIHDRKKAIRHALDNAQASDIVVIAGKGHEQYQIIGKQKIAYPADISIATDVLKSRSNIKFDGEFS